jgi:hypothetical protein
MHVKLPPSVLSGLHTLIWIKPAREPGLRQEWLNCWQKKAAAELRQARLWRK